MNEEPTLSLLRQTRSAQFRSITEAEAQIKKSREDIAFARKRIEILDAAIDAVNTALDTRDHSQEPGA